MRTEQIVKLQKEVTRLKNENKHYRKALNNILSVKKDKEFNRYAYMKLEIFEWAEEALEEGAE